MEPVEYLILSATMKNRGKSALSCGFLCLSGARREKSAYSHFICQWARRSCFKNSRFPLIYRGFPRFPTLTVLVSTRPGFLTFILSGYRNALLSFSTAFFIFGSFAPYQIDTLASGSGANRSICSYRASASRVQFWSVSREIHGGTFSNWANSFSSSVLV